MAAQTISTHDTATSAVRARRACADISAAAANNAIASTKPAGAIAAIDFEAACDSPAFAAHISRYRSRNARKKSRLTTTTIRAAVSRAVNQGTVSAPTEFPNVQAGFIDKRTVNAQTPTF